MKEFAELKDVKIDDIVLLHENDTHFNLIIAKDNELAKFGSLSYMTNIVPLMKTNELDENKEKGRTFVDAVVNGSKVTEASKDEIEIERLQTALQKITEPVQKVVALIYRTMQIHITADELVEAFLLCQ